MDGLQADQTWLLLALQSLVLMSHESLKVCAMFCQLLAASDLPCLLCSTFIIG